MKLSIIIPVLNEEKLLPVLLDHLTGLSPAEFEIIIVDGGSKDRSIDIARSYPVILIVSPVEGRAIQMNMGSEAASGEILYFVHADTIPPMTFYQDILQLIKSGYDLGSFRLKLYSSKPNLLFINSFFTRFSGLMFQGGGDQSLFIKKDVFNSLGGYNESFIIMEDFEFLRKARKKFKFGLIPANISVSDRKYRKNHYLQVQLANLGAYTAFQLNISPVKIKSWYSFMLK